MTKKQSSALYGIAILLMLYFHLFGAPGLTNVQYTSVLCFGKVVNLERLLSWFGRICVGIYAFISGYGLFCSMQKIKAPDDSLWRQLQITYWSIGKRIFAFMRKYWIVFCIFVPIGFALGVYQPNGWLFLIENFLSYRFDYNGAWWYVMQYLFMILLLPAIDLFFDFVFIKQRRSFQTAVVLVVQGVCYTALFFLVFLMHKNAVYYTLIFIAGYACSRFELFSKAIKRIPTGGISYLVGCVLVILTVSVRSLLAKNAGHIGSDVVLAPVFCFAICLLTRKDGKIAGCFAWLGKYSVYMWLTHNFYWLYFFQDFITITHISTFMYL